MTRRVFISAVAAAAAAPLLGRAAAPAVSDREIVIGQTLAVTGPLSTLTKTFMAGAQLAFDESDRQGGIWGRKLRLVTLNDELNAEKAAANCRALLDEHRAFTFFCTTGTDTTVAASKVLREEGAALFAPFAVLDSAREKTAGTAYFTRATLARESDALVQHLATIGVSRIALAYIDQPMTGPELAAIFEQAFTRHKLKAQAVAAVKLDGTNLPDVTRTLLAGNPQVVIMALAGPQAPQLMQSIWNMGAGPSFYGLSVVPGDLVAKILGNKSRTITIVQVAPSPWGEADPLIRRYRVLATAAKVPVDYLSVEGFLSAQVMIEALKRCGKDLTRPRLQAVLRSFSARIGGMHIDFTGGQFNGSRFVELVQVGHDGRFVR
ncbi:MAG TPA: ABC transporter substrate-binding protein [Burkholderiaceae bacterium]|nr:ABC transporter substrate-binding protein [Burkholderiaceae bacterium]